MQRSHRTTIMITGAILLVGLSTGCAQPMQRTCPTARINCDCFALEDEQPQPGVAELIRTFEDLSDPSLQRPIGAVSDIEQLCRAEEGWLPPPEEERDSDWRVRCSSAERALPPLLRTLEAVESARGPIAGGGQLREQQSTLVVGIVSALGNTLLGNPESPCRHSVIDALAALLETPETAQSFRINFHAIRYLGALGDSRALQPMVRALFIQSARRRADLFEDARVALNQVDNQEAAVAALIRAGRLEDEALNQLQQDEPGFDMRFIKERVALMLGELGHRSPSVFEYLMAELRHEEEDALDNSLPIGGVRFTPALSKSHRRAWAAGALGRLGHRQALDVILPRLELNEDGSSVDPTVDISEIPGYFDAIGDILAPRQTNPAYLLWLTRGDATLRDHAARRLMLQADSRVIEPLTAAMTGLPQCSAGPDCVRQRFQDVYIPTLRASADCTTVACWSQRLTDASSSEAMRMRAAYQLVMLSSGAQRDTARAAVLETLTSAHGEALDVGTFALDRLSPNGCDAACLAAIASAAESRASDGPQAAERRRLSALHARLRSRAE